MRKNLLSLSIAAMIGGLGVAGGASAAVFGAGATATALAPTSTGVGHILVVPYYTVNNNNYTAINLTNTDTKNGKAVKVRFRGATNSDDVLDFQVYMSPADVWTAAITKSATGGLQLTTYDRSCVLPVDLLSTRTSDGAISAVADLSRLPASYTAAQKAAETAEGYIEILNMADVPKALQNGQFAVAPAVTNNPLWDAIKHTANVPAGCSASAVTALLATDPVTDVSASSAGAAQATNETTASALGLAYPTGGLSMNWTIVNTVSTLTFSGQATALNAAVSSSAPEVAGAKGNLVFSPQNTPAVGSAAVATGSADPLFQYATGNVLLADFATNPAAGQVPAIVARQFDLPDLSTPYTGAITPKVQAANLTKAFATQSIINEFLVTPGLSAMTDWTFSMPTRRYNVGMNYNWTSTTQTDGRYFTAANGYFDNTNTAINANNAKGICVTADATKGLVSWNREETTTGNAGVLSPNLGNQVMFCGEVSVLSFNAGSTTAPSVLGGSLARQDNVLAAGTTEGWTRIGTSGLANAGLPIIGNAFIKAVGGTSNYGITWDHRYVR